LFFGGFVNICFPTVLHFSLEFNHGHGIEEFYHALSNTQIRSLLTSYELPVTLERRSSYVGTPSQRNTETLGWQILTDATLKYIASLYNESTLKGDTFLCSNQDVFQIQACIDISFDITHPNKQLLTPLVRIAQHISHPMGLIHILCSTGIQDPFHSLTECILQWALFDHIRPKGISLLVDMIQSNLMSHFQGKGIPELRQWVETIDDPIHQVLVDFFNQLDEKTNTMLVQ
jgi:hypothetical protein